MHCTQGLQNTGTNAPGLPWRKALLLGNLPNMTIVVSQDDGGGLIGCGFFDLVDHRSKDGLILEASQEGSFRIETFQNIPFNNNGSTGRIAGIKQASLE